MFCFVISSFYYGIIFVRRTLRCLYFVVIYTMNISNNKRREKNSKRWQFSRSLLFFEHIRLQLQLQLQFDFEFQRILMSNAGCFLFSILNWFLFGVSFSFICTFQIKCTPKTPKYILFALCCFSNQMKWDEMKYTHSDTHVIFLKSSFCLSFVGWRYMYVFFCEIVYQQHK